MRELIASGGKKTGAGGKRGIPGLRKARTHQTAWKDAVKQAEGLDFSAPYFWAAFQLFGSGRQGIRSPPVRLTGLRPAPMIAAAAKREA